MKTVQKPADKGFFGGPSVWAVAGVPLIGVGLLIGFKLFGLNPFVAGTAVLLLVVLAVTFRWSRSRGWPRAIREIAVPAIPAYLLFIAIGWGGLSLGGAGESWSYGSLALATLAMCGAFLLFTMGRSAKTQE